MKATVKIMRSYDYNHFEVALSSDINLTPEGVDDMRKQAARLVDKAVEQYQIARRAASQFPDEELARRAKAVRENFPQSEWTEEQKALVKQAEDNAYWTSREYDYQDDWLAA